jgi:ribosomal protein S18 acetylase RimI-like enzyme
MTRMFVAPKFQRRGIGERLALQLLKESREAGYKTMRLDTGSKQGEAQAMYRKIGFTEMPPPKDLPKEFEGMVISMEFHHLR